MIRAPSIALILTQAFGPTPLGISGWLHRALGLDEVMDHQNPGDPVALHEGPRDAVLVIDASGSMRETDWRPSRLEAARKAAKAFIKRLAENEPEARVGVVAYGDSAATVRKLTSVTKYASLARAIDRIHTLGWTNITSGLKAASEMLKPTERPAQIVVLSDGHHNRGPRPYKIAEALKRRAVIECVGIGGRKDVEESLLKCVASAYPDGRKRYRWIGDPEGLVEHYKKLAGRITRS